MIKNVILKQQGIHITHNDADGIACGVISALLMPDINWDLKMCAIGTQDDEFKKSLDTLNSHSDDDTRNIPEFIIVSDISMNEESLAIIDDLYNAGTIVIGVDHHVTNTADYPWFDIVIRTEPIWMGAKSIEQPVSAAYLLFNKIRENCQKYKACGINVNDSFFEDRLFVYGLVQNVSRYDTFAFRDSAYDNDNENMFEPTFWNAMCMERSGMDAFEMMIHPFTYELTADRMNIFERYFTIYREIERRTEYALNKILNRASKYSMYNGYQSIIFYGGTPGDSIIANKILEVYNDIADIIIILYPETLTVSFRSLSKGRNIDVSKIAKVLGGGGHKNASGAKLTNNFDKFVEFMSLYETGTKLKDMPFGIRNCKYKED